MKDKTNLKIIVAVIVSVIISSSITALAAIKFQANEVGYNTTTVADALDSLYQTKFSDNYSTEERVIGKYLDGKPLYQKTIIKNDASSINVTNLNVDTPVWIEACATMNGEYCVPSGYYYEGWNYFTVAFRRSSIDFTAPTQADNGPFVITIKYTKTTDQAANNNQ